jgi:hypothetical protein
MIFIHFLDFCRMLDIDGQRNVRNRTRGVQTKMPKAAPGDGANGADGGVAVRPPPRVKARHKEILLWDDEGFRRRVQTLAQQRGIPLADAMKRAGVASDYTYRASDARSTNVVMRLAEQFGVTPAELAGWTIEPSPPAIPDALLRSLQEQHKTALLIVAGMAKGQSLAKLAEIVGIDRKVFSQLVRRALEKPSE